MMKGDVRPRALWRCEDADDEVIHVAALDSDEALGFADDFGAVQPVEIELVPDDARHTITMVDGWDDPDSDPDEWRALGFEVATNCRDLPTVTGTARQWADLSAGYVSGGRF